MLLTAAYVVPTRASESKDLKKSQTSAAKAHTSATHHAKRARASKRLTETQGPPYATRAVAMQAADAIAVRLGLDAQWVREAIGQSRYMPGIARAIAPPPVGTPKNWAVYRSRFVEPMRIRAGVKFWLNNRETLERAEQQTGVPASIIVGIIGVETIYG
ncbi:MAG: lytic murein transglycosylase, partial [Rhodoferax sp.]